jgi:hypothetical protein
MILGLDNLEHKLLVLKKLQDNKPQSIVISLADVKSCAVTRHYDADQKFDNRQKKNTKKIVLRFLLHDGTTEEIDFYNQNVHGEEMLNNLAGKANTWERILSASKYRAAGLI